jgi:hypothetical protein
MDPDPANFLIEGIKKSQNMRYQGFSYYFCMMIEGSRSGPIPLTSGSESGRPKNTWIRIRNTALDTMGYIRFPSKGLDSTSYIARSPLPVPSKIVEKKNRRYFNIFFS